MSFSSVDRALDNLRQGLPIMIFDSGFREAETDLIFPALALDASHIRRLRQEAGGLLFLGIGHEIAERFGLPFLEQVYESARSQHPVLDSLRTDGLAYDSRSAFSLSINHRETITGIPDGDRARTGRRFAELAAESADASPEECLARLGAEFRTPGHLWICREDPGGLATRKGHTELMVAAARLAGIQPVLVAAEFLEPDGDRALVVDEAVAHAKRIDLPIIEGAQLEAAIG